MNERNKELIEYVKNLDINIEEMSKLIGLNLPKNIFQQGLIEFLICVALIDDNISEKEIKVISNFTGYDYEIEGIKSKTIVRSKLKNGVPQYIQIIMLIDKLFALEKELINACLNAYEEIGYNMIGNGSIEETRNLNSYRNIIARIKKFIDENYDRLSAQEVKTKIEQLIIELKDKDLILDVADREPASFGDSTISNSNFEERNVETIKKDNSNDVKESSINEKVNKIHEENLKSLLQNLDSYIGLKRVKEEVKSLVNLIEIRNKRSIQGLKNPDMSFHLCFMGNPGTGKTTVARIVSKIYKELGIISKGHLVEVARNDLVGGYVGQTGIKTKEIITKAYGGVLFIDEAYSLTNKGNENDYGQEAIEVILKEMEDNRSDLVVIVAGYTNLMKEFLNSNPGLESRFNIFINFEDYSPKELVEIVKMQCENNDYVIDEECENYLLSFMKRECMDKKEDFSNARFARNVFENAIKKQSIRLAKLDNLCNEDLRKLAKEDFLY